MAAKTYRLKIGDFEAEGDKAFVSEMLKRYGPHVRPVSPEPPAGTKGEKGLTKRASEVARPTSGKALSIREFIQQLDLKRHTDISLAFGYYLEKHQGSAKFLFATVSANSAAPYIISTGKAVMALGGFTGSDPILSASKLAALVRAGTVRYFLLGGGGQGGNEGGQSGR